MFQENGKRIAIASEKIALHEMTLLRNNNHDELKSSWFSFFESCSDKKQVDLRGKNKQIFI